MKKEKIIKKILTIFVCMLCFCLEVQAKSTTDQFKETFIGSYSFIDSKGHYGNFEHFTRKSDGETAYCIEPGVSLAKNTDYNGYYGLSNEELADKVNLSTDKLIKVSQIAYYGYGYKNHNSTRWIVATQALIWEELGRNFKFTSQYLPDPSNPNKYVIDTPSEIKEAMKEIEDLVEEHYNQPTFQTYNAKILYGSDYTFHDQANQLKRYNIKHCENCNATIQNDNLVVTPTAAQDGYITLDKENNYWANEFIVYHSDKGQDVMIPGNLDPVQTRVNFKVISGTLNLKKYDNENNQCSPSGQAELVGAVYGLYKENGELFKELTIDSNCSATVDKLPIQNYYVQEIKPSKGYKLDTIRYSVNFSENQTVVNLDVKEQVIKNYISILKQYEFIDGNTAFLNAEQNITFEIYYPNGNKFDEITTDENGYASINLPYGVWKFHQVNTNSGFEKIYDFYITVDEISEKEQYYNILNNALSAYLQVFKTDSETGKTIAIAGTTFRILNTDTNQYVSQFIAGKVYDTFTTDENGKFITYLKLEAGNYRLIEVSSPNGYLINSDGLDFNIGDGTHYSYSTYGAFVTFYFENKPIKGQIEVNKTGESVIVENNTFHYEFTSLEGVKFNIYASEDILSADGNFLYYNAGDLVDTIITNKNGYAISKELPLGKYYLVEVETKENYVLDNEKHYITLTEIDNETRVVYESISKLNYLKKSDLEFTKTDLTTGKGIPNVKVEIYHIDDNTSERELVFTGTTDSEGKITIKDLFVGKFVIIEKEAATGYRLSDEEVFFEIKENGEIVKANMTNEKITSTVKIHKVDEDGNAIKGVTIGVYDLEGNLIYSGTTDENGDIEFVVEYGSYYFQEIATLDEFELSDEKVYFDVTEDGEYIQKTLVNELKEIEVPNTSSNTYIDIIASVIVLAGASLIVISSKRKNKK